MLRSWARCARSMCVISMRARVLDVWLCWQVLQFFIMYRVAADVADSRTWEYRLPQIARRYVSSWCVPTATGPTAHIHSARILRAAHGMLTSCSLLIAYSWRVHCVAAPPRTN
jgi:hypothetical protein